MYTLIVCPTSWHFYIGSYPNYLFVVFGGWVNLAVVSAWHLFYDDHPYCTDSGVLLFLSSDKCTYGKSQNVNVLHFVGKIMNGVLRL